MKQQAIIILITFFLLLSGKELFAQHELSLYGGGGLSTLNYKPTFGEQKFGLGGHFGLGYHFFFTPSWGIGTGAELAFYNARFNMEHFYLHYPTVDIDEVAFEFRSKVSGHEETQRTMMLQIPLMLQFQTAKTKHQFFLAVGGKAGIPFNSEYSTSASFKNEGFYAYENSLYDTQEHMGFGNFDGKKVKGDLDFKTAFFLSAETGMKWRLGKILSLYTGLYLDYGLNNIVEKKDVASIPFLVEYNSANPPAFAVNSILQSTYRQNETQRAFTGKVNPIAVGVKLRLAFGKNYKRKEVQTDPPPVYTSNNTTVVDQGAAEREAARKAAEEKAAADRRAQELEAKRAAEVAAKAQWEADALNRAKKQIEQPIDDYALLQIKLSDNQIEKLDEKIELLKQFVDLRFYIYGYTCEIGTVDNNEYIGLQRAAKAKAHIISKGINENRILDIDTKRSADPVVPNTNEENRRKNRRVQLVIQ